MICFLDMDGVLTDFVNGALEMHNKVLPPAEVTWGFPKQIGFSGVDDPKFWEPLGYQFWSNLEWTKEGRELLYRLEVYFGLENICLLSSPCQTPGCVEGKVAWIKREMPHYARRFFIGPPKHMIAGTDKLLIDDYEDNTRLWRENGGKAVLVPRPCNSYRCMTYADGSYDVDWLMYKISLNIA